jgi:hypothetical protein
LTSSSEHKCTGLDGFERRGDLADAARFSPRWYWLLALALHCSSCAGARHDWLVYDGRRLHPNNDELALPRFDAPPPRARVLGSLSAACDGRRPSAAVVDMPMIALVCSPAWLAVAIEERAKAVGGTALQHFSCSSVESPEGRWERVECAAEVLAGDFLGATTAAPRLRRTYRVSAVLAATVEYRAEGGKAQGPARSATRSGGEPAKSPATEVSSTPASDVVLGALRVRVPGDGTAEEARAGLLLAAGNLGGAHVVAPTCVPEPKGRGFSCTAPVTAPEVEGAR